MLTKNISNQLHKSAKYNTKRFNSGKVLVTGAGGQVGQIIHSSLLDRYGENNVLYTDVDLKNANKFKNFEQLDALDSDKVLGLIEKYKPTQVIHLPSLQSAMGEQKPELMEIIGIGSFKIVAQGCIKNGASLFCPSSIAVYGSTSEQNETPEQTALEPMTIYGCTKVYLELLGNYYRTKYGLDFRSLRYPGIFSAARPGGGTTDYVTLMMYDGIEHNKHICYLKKDTAMPMMDEDDLIKGTMDFITAPQEKLTRSSYNIGGFSCSPESLHNEQKKYIPDLNVEYKPDFRQGIANSWPNTLCDEAARADWGWVPQYGFEDSVLKTLFGVVKECEGNKGVENNLSTEMQQFVNMLKTQKTN